MSNKTRKQQIEDLLAVEPDDPFLRYGLAMEFVSARNDQEAARCFRDLLALAPDYVPAYLQAGQALIRLERADEARSLLRQGIAAAQQKGEMHAAEEMQGFLAGLETP